MPRPAALLAVVALHGTALVALWPGPRAAQPVAVRGVAVKLLVAAPPPAAAATAWRAAPPLLHRPAVAMPALPGFEVQELEAEPVQTEPAATAPPAVRVAAAPPPPPAGAREEPALQSARRAACAPAPHPLALRERGIEGVVRLRVWVDELGRAGQVLLAASSGWRLFDDAAVAQARRCPFHPAQRGNQPVGSWVEFPVRFALESAHG